MSLSVRNAPTQDTNSLPFVKGQGDTEFDSTVSSFATGKTYCHGSCEGYEQLVQSDRGRTSTGRRQHKNI